MGALFPRLCCLLNCFLIVSCGWRIQQTQAGKVSISKWTIGLPACWMGSLRSRGLEGLCCAGTQPRSHVVLSLALLSAASGSPAALLYLAVISSSGRWWEQVVLVACDSGSVLDSGVLPFACGLTVARMSDTSRVPTLAYSQSPPR